MLRRIVLHPVDFFAGIPRREGLRNPFLFALICFVIGAVLTAVVDLIGVQNSFQSFEGLLPLGLSSQSFTGFAAIAVMFVVIGVIGLLVGAVICQLLVRVVVGRGNAGFDATFRMVAYTAAVNLVGWIPILGLLAGLYSLYLQVVGLREVHETSTGEAILVLLLFVGVWTVVGGVLGAILIAQSAP